VFGRFAALTFGLFVFVQQLPSLPPSPAMTKDSDDDGMHEGRSSGSSSSLYKAKIQPGYKGGTKLIFKNNNSVDGGSSSDSIEVVFVLKEGKHTHYRRVGNDLHYRCKATAPPTAGAKDDHRGGGDDSDGFEVTVDRLGHDETPIKVKVPPGFCRQETLSGLWRWCEKVLGPKVASAVVSATMKRNRSRTLAFTVKGEGWPVRRTKMVGPSNPGGGRRQKAVVIERGDLIIHVDIEFATKTKQHGRQQHRRKRRNSRRGRQPI